MSEKLIMIVGSMGSGKSIAAELLGKYGFKEDMFAGALKEFAISVGFTQEQVYGTQAQKLVINEFWGISAREFLQKFGSEVCRIALPAAIPNMKMNGRTLWARTIEQKISKFPLMVISDGRFLDEAQLVKDHKGIIIRLNRDACRCQVTCDGVCKKLAGEHGNHVSETSMSEIKEDYRIDNNGSIMDLENALCMVLEQEGLALDNLQEHVEDKSVSKTTVAIASTAIAAVAVGLAVVGSWFIPQ